MATSTDTAGITPEDLKRESRIGELGALVICDDSPSSRRAYLQMLMKEVAARSPAAVAAMEQKQGLA